MKPFPSYPPVKSWHEWRTEMEACARWAVYFVASGKAEQAGDAARKAAHAAFYI